MARKTANTTAERGTIHVHNLGLSNIAKISTVSGLSRHWNARKPPKVIPDWFSSCGTLLIRRDEQGKRARAILEKVNAYNVSTNREIVT